MSRREKQGERLQALEQEFVAILRRHLHKVADGFETGFFGAERFCAIYPNLYLRRQQRPIEAILSLGDEILRLCEQLEEDPSPSVLALHRACEEASDLANDHRLGPIRLARRLLEELGAG